MNRCRKTSMKGITIPLLLYSLFSILIISSAVDTISKTQIVSDGQTIVSFDETFEMGFFSPGGSKNRYVGIWYKKISPGLVVWVANREIPLNDTLGVLKVIEPGILVLLNGTNNTIWSTYTSRTVQNPVVQLLDSGNLVVRDANDNSPDNFLWQGFDYPGDTLLPGMKLGKSLVTAQEWYISSWKSKDDPAKGDYTFWLDLRGYPQIFIRNGSVDLFRTGPWNGLRFSGVPTLQPNQIFNFGMYFERQEVFYRYDLYNISIVSRFVINSNGVAQRWTWVDRTRGWVLYRNIPIDNCDTYKLCGPYGSCEVNSFPICSCLEKFVPRYRKDWEMTDWSGGCVRRIQLDCHNGDGFVKYSNIKLPDTRSSWYNMTMTLLECKEVCLKNCSCMAYTNLDVRGGGNGCLLWFDELVDIREFSENGQDIYIRIASSDLDSPVQHGGTNDKKKMIVIVALTIITGMFLLGLCILLYFRKRKKNDERLRTEESDVQRSRHGHSNQSQKEDLELPMFEFDIIASCTNNFSADNKLGEGGFGPVHKGGLEDGREIAVKRLSKTSRQGLDEFKNEVICIAKLQHRNLVKLLGCCIQGEERMLIYEFMPNKSLDSFIFDENGRTLLDWPKRYNIINDFGTARIFGGNETEGNTARVVGTYGYMSPEYAVDGLFSVKSDVFSFGVLVMEIVSGKRNRGFFHPDHYLNLVGHAWTLHNEDRSIELIDPTARESCCPSEVLRSIRVGLLCVQRHPEDRPSMSSVVLMLGSEGSLPWPKQPGFFTDRNPYEANTSSSKNAPTSTSTNDLTITVVEPR